MEYFDESEYYKVTNLAVIPFHMTWNKALMTDEDLENYEAYKLTKDYKGHTEEERIARNDVAEAVKMRAFVETFGKDVQIKSYEKVKDGKKVITKTRQEWVFAIGPNVEQMIKDNDLSATRRTCQKYDILIKREDDVKVLAKKLKDKFGENKRVLTSKQWEESGLKGLERKEIVGKLKPGELTRKITNEGYLVAEPMADIEIEDKKDESK